MKTFLWAIPRGESDRLHEKPLTSFSLTASEVELVKAAASKDGWHSFRTTPDDNRKPDFAGAVLCK